MKDSKKQRQSSAKLHSYYPTTKKGHGNEKLTKQDERNCLGERWADTAIHSVDTLVIQF